MKGSGRKTEMKIKNEDETATVGKGEEGVKYVMKNNARKIANWRQEEEKMGENMDNDGQGRGRK